MEGDRDPEAYRQGHRKDGCESPGRNESERVGGLENEEIRGPSLQPKGEGSMGWRTLTEAPEHSGGVLATAWWQGCAKQLEKPSSSRREIGGSWVGRITGSTGKSADDERVEDGSVVAMKRSNVRGARGPCCL